MNKQEKQVEQAQLNKEKQVLKDLKAMYQEAIDSIGEKVQLLQLDPLSQSKAYQAQFQQVMKSQIATFLDLLHDKEYDTIEEFLKDSYNNGFIGAMYSIHAQGIPLILPIAQEQVVKAIQIDSKIKEGLYKKLGNDIKDLKKVIRTEVARGISQNMGYSDIARNISNVSNTGLNNAMRIARTESHRVKNQAAYDAANDSQKAGADVLKQWDASMDGATRPSHRAVDGEIRELDEKFSNGLRYAGDPSGSAAEVINCRCATLTRARWALDEDELDTLKERAEYYGLDKSEQFEDYKKKYLETEKIEAEVQKPKKEYLTEKKLAAKIQEAENEIQALYAKYGDDILKFGSGVPAEDTIKYLQLTTDKDEWTEKLNKKLVAKETKKLKKEQAALQEQIDNFDIKSYSDIWKDDVTVADWAAKKDSVDAKKKYFENKLLTAADANEMQQWKDKIQLVDEFNVSGAEYYKLTQELKQSQAALKKLQKNGIINQPDDKFSQERKDAAHWFTDKNGGTKGADGVLRDVCGDVWKNASKAEQDAIYDYTQSYHKFNEPLRGIEYGTNKFLGVGNVDLDKIGVNYGGYKVGQVKKEIDDMTSIIAKSSYTEDIWVQRGCGYGGMDKFFGIDPNDFYLPEAELAAKLIGTEPTEYGFMSTGVSKGKGFSHQPIIMNIYAPSGTKMMYAEPFSAFGNGAGKKWDGVSPQSSFGSEAEMILQRGTTFRVTKVEKSGSKIYIDMEVIEQEEY